MTRRLAAGAFSLICMVQCARAGLDFIDVTGTRTAEDPVVLGEWNVGFDKCKAYAEANDIPMVVVWSDSGCSICTKVGMMIISDAFRQWVASDERAKIVWCYVNNGDNSIPNPPDQGINVGANAWCFNNGIAGSAWPFTVFYWSSKGVRAHYCGGDAVLGAYDSGNPGASVPHFKEIFYQCFAGWEGPAGSSYEGGRFVVGTEPRNRLEVEVGTTEYVDVPLERDAECAQLVSNTLYAVSGETAVNCGTVVWTDNARRFLRVPVPKDIKAGDTIRLELRDERGKTFAESAVFAVAPQPVSATNPRWRGASPGEWTMDFEAATNLVATSGAGAYTLVFMTGVKWCPHCRGLERQVFSTAAFGDFVRKYKMALVVLDNPGRTKGVWTDKPQAEDCDDAQYRPSLLRYRSGKSSNATNLYVSGAAYLSRNMISTNEAETTLLRNHRYGYDPVAAGGYCQPHMLYNSYPTLMLLDHEGRIVGWMPCKANGGLTTELNDGAFVEDPADHDRMSTYDVEATMRRLEDLVARGADGTEASNDDWATTPLALPVQTVVPVTNELSAVDLNDVWRLDGYSAEVTVAVSGPKAAPVALSFVRRRSDGEYEALTDAAVTGDLKEGLVAKVMVGSNPVYLRVKADPAAGQAFDPFSEGDTRRVYAIAATAGLAPSDHPLVWTNETDSVAVSVTSGHVYRIAGTKTIDPTAFADLGGGLYRALKTGKQTLVLRETDGRYVLNCRLWDVGKIGFDPSMDPIVIESDSVHYLKLARVDGASGRNVVRVRYRPDVGAEAADIASGRFELPEPWTREIRANVTNWLCETVWEDGDDAVKSLPIRLHNDNWNDGDQTVTFELERVEGEADWFGPLGDVGPRWTMTLMEDDVSYEGIAIGIVGSRPAMARQMYLVAHEESDVQVSVQRPGSGAGGLVARLQVYVGGKAYGEGSLLRWVGRETLCSAFVRMPAYAEYAKTRDVRIVLEPVSAVDVRQSAKTVTVEVIPETATTALDASLSLTNYTGVSIGRKSIHVQTPKGNASFVMKTSGAVPPGLSCAYDADAGDMVLSGVPAVAGRYSVVFELFAVAPDGKTTKGGSLSFACEVLDLRPAVQAAAESAAGAALEPVSLARIWRDVPVVADGVLAGLLNVQLAESGRGSAKLRSPEGVFSYSCRGWSEFAGGALKATLEGAGGAVSVSVPVSGVATAVLTGVPGVGDGVGCELDAPALTALPREGVYTVQLPQTNAVAHAPGDAVLSLRTSSADGTMCYVGVLPDGQPVRGNVTLRQGAAEDVAALPICSRRGGRNACAFTGILDVKALKSPPTSLAPLRSVKPSGRVCLQWTRSVTNVSHRSHFEAFGGMWTLDGLRAACSGNLGTTRLRFGIESEAAKLGWPSATSGLPSGDMTCEVCVVGKEDGKGEGLEFGSPTVGRASFFFNPATGIVSGRLLLPCEKRTVSATFRGALLPGWPSLDNDCGCGQRTVETPPNRHFMSGSMWFVDRSAEGRTFRNGTGVAIDVPEEENK